MTTKRFPIYHNGRRIIVLSRRTIKGQSILARAYKNVGYTLSSCYKKPSPIKCQIYEDCYQQFLSDINAHDFHICSYNVNQFTVSWTTESGVVVLLTRDCEYIVTD